MRVNTVANATTQFRVLTDDQCEAIFLATLEVLERTGVDIAYPEAVDLLRGAGARTDGTRVRIPSAMVRQALASAPPRFTIYSRDPAKSIRIEPNVVNYGPGPTCPNFFDPYTRERRLYVRQDAAWTALVCDALPNIAFVESLGSISDVPQELADVIEFADMSVHTAKPIVAWSFSLESCRSIHQMAIAIAGGEEAFAQRPNYIFYAEPSSPLSSNREAAEKLLYCAEHHIPIVYTPCPIAAATSPATLAGVLVNALAESLHGLVIAQLTRPGAPFIAGGVVSIMDLAKTILSYGAPELALMSAGLTEVLRHIGLPMWSTGGCTDSKLPDEQAALECTLNLAAAGLSGANLVHDVGFMESALTGSLQVLVMSDEIIGMVRRLLRGIEVTRETLAVDVIDQVGPGKQFIDQDHTLKHFRREFWFPGLMDRTNWAKWEAAGSKRMGDRVDERVREIVESHPAPGLPPEVKRQLDAIVEQRRQLL